MKEIFSTFLFVLFIILSIIAEKIVKGEKNASNIEKRSTEHWRGRGFS